MSLFGATISQRGSSNCSAKTLTLNPAGALGTKPFGGVLSSGAFVADLVENGGGNFGFFPSVTWAGKIEGTKSRAPNRAPNTIPLRMRDMKSPQKVASWNAH